MANATKRFSSRYLLDKIYSIYRPLSRRQKRYLLITTDIFLFCASIYLAFFLRFETLFPFSEIFKHTGLIITLFTIKLLAFRFKGIYSPIIRYTDVEFLGNILQAVFFSSITSIVLAYLQGLWPIPRSILIIDAFLTLFLVIGVRLLIRSSLQNLIVYTQSKQCQERLLIYGAGKAGYQLVRGLLNDPNYCPVAFVDDNPDLHWQTVVKGLKVYSSSDISKLWHQRKFDTVILAMPSINRKNKLRIIEKLQDLSIPVKTTPTLGEILSGKVAIQKIRNVDITELLEREEVAPDTKLLQKQVKDKIVLVTGAGGSIGSELCRQIAQQQPKCLILYELNELALYSIDLELSENFPCVQRYAYLGNVTNQDYLKSILNRHQVETVYHAAAYKHVPLVEANPARGIENNVLGTFIAARCAIDCQVNNFVLISTDKAVRPTNVMGASKRVAEMIIQAFATQPEMITRFAIVRFGNVLNSSGSVVPRFRKLIAQGKSITVTHKDITRYFMSIPEAARLVMQAGAMAKGGEVFLLEMGEPVRIYDLAEKMIRLSGLKIGHDIDIEITGLRPGEKLYEELLIEGKNVKATEHPKIFCAREHFWEWEILQSELNILLENARTNNTEELLIQLCKIVPEYQPKNSLSKTMAKAKFNTEIVPFN